MQNKDQQNRESISNQDNNFETTEKKELIALPGEKKKGIRILLSLLLAVVIIGSVCTFIAGIMKYNQLLKEKQELEDKLEDLKKDKEQLEYLKESPIDYDYIVREARKLGMYFPDEKVYYNDGQE